MNIRDIRVGMKLVFGIQKIRMTKDKAYEVLAIEDEDDGEEGIVHVRDDENRARGFYAKRFERIAEAVPAIPHKFNVGDEVLNRWDRKFKVFHVLPNGFVFLEENGKKWENDKLGFDPANFNLAIVANVPQPAHIPFADMAAERAPEAPQQAAVAAPKAGYVPKIGDRVRLLNGRLMARNPNAGWVGQFDVKVGREWAIKDVNLARRVVYFENDDAEWAYSFDHIEFARAAVPDRPFSVGDFVKQRGFRTLFKVLELLDEGRIRISREDNHELALGVWHESKFELVQRGDAEKPKAIIKFEVGNHVKVVKKTAGNPKWVEGLDVTVGKVYKIERYDEWAKAYQLTNGFMYKAEALELAKEEDIKMAKKAVKKFPDLRSLIAQSRKEDIKGVGGVSSYVVFVKNTDTGEITLNKHLRDVCHARLAVYYPDWKVNKEAVAVIDYQQEHYKQVEERAGKEFIPSYKKFVDYIVNRSPWAVAFQGKTVKNVLENGVLMNVEAPSGAVAGACQALRYLSEFDCQNAIWKLMMDNGIQEDAAFLTTYAFKKEANGTFTKNPMGGGHQPINGAIPAGSLISFFANGYNEAFLKSETYRTRTSYIVHKHVEDVKDVLHIPSAYNTYVSANVEWTKKKEGWAEVKFATEEQVLTFARHLEQQINKAREAK